MKQAGFFSILMACGVALLAVFATASAQAAAGRAVVRTVRGSAEYTEGTQSGPLKVGKVLKSGAVVKTAANSQVDLFLGENGPVVRINQASTLALDKLTFEQTGIDTVIETEMNLKSGEILGNVKKLAKASNYEVKTPMGVAGIRGTQYNINADSGAVTVISGTVMFSYVNAAGVATVITVEAGNTFTPPADRSVVPTQASSVAPTPPAVEAAAIDAVIASTTVSNPGQLQAAIKEIASTKAAQAAAAAPPGQGNAAAVAAAQAVVSAATATAQQAAQTYTGSGAAAVRNSASQAGAQSADMQVSSAAAGASLSAAASAAVQAQAQGQSQAQIQQAAQNAAQAAAGQTAAAAGGTAGQIASATGQANNTGVQVAQIVTAPAAPGAPPPTLASVVGTAVATLPGVITIELPPAPAPPPPPPPPPTEPVDQATLIAQKRAAALEKLKKDARAQFPNNPAAADAAAAAVEISFSFDQTSDGTDPVAIEAGQDNAKIVGATIVADPVKLNQAIQEIAARKAAQAAAAPPAGKSSAEAAAEAAAKAVQAATETAQRAAEAHKGTGLTAALEAAASAQAQSAANTVSSAAIGAARSAAATEALAARAAGKSEDEVAQAAERAGQTASGQVATVLSGTAAQLTEDQLKQINQNVAQAGQNVAQVVNALPAGAPPPTAFNVVSDVNTKVAQGTIVITPPPPQPAPTPLPTPDPGTLRGIALGDLKNFVTTDTQTEHPGLNQAAIEKAQAAAEAAFLALDLTPAGTDDVALAAAKAAADYASRAMAIPAYSTFSPEAKAKYDALVAQAAAVAGETYKKAIDLAGLTEGQASVAADKAGEAIKNKGVLIEGELVVTAAERTAAIDVGLNAGKIVAPATPRTEPPLVIVDSTQGYLSVIRP